MTALGKLWFRYSESSRGFFINDDADPKSLGNRQMGRSRSNRTAFFNGLSRYERLLKKKGCIDVKISSVRVTYGCLRLGIVLQPIYRLTFDDGRSEIRDEGEILAPLPFRRLIYETFVLNENEYITGIHASAQIQGITFVTNQRREHFGYAFGDFAPLEMMTPAPPDASMRIIAFCGGNGWDPEHRKIGFYAQVLRWHYHGPYVLMRQLVHDGRAHIPHQVEDCDNEEGDGLLPSIMQGLIHLDEDVFRNVMKFLA